MFYLFGEKIIYITGIVNIVSLLLVLSSCRCIGGFNFFQKLMKYRFFSKIYRYHCWFWIIFIISVLAHSILAFIVYGNPFTP